MSEQLSIFTDVTQNRHQGNIHSSQANERAQNNKSYWQKQICEFAASVQDFTLKEACRHFEKLPNELSGRLSELKASGALEVVKGETREGCGVLRLRTGETEAKGFYRCRKCKKETLWLYHKDTQKPAPIEAEPSENGNIFIKGDLYRIATKEEIAKAKEIGKPLYLNHFASCEFAKSFRKEK